MVVKIFISLNIHRNTIKSIIKTWYDYGTTGIKGGLPTKASERALVRETSKNTRVTLNMILPPTCFTVGIVFFL